MNSGTAEDALATVLQMPTEGIVKAEGLNWQQVIAVLMQHILPWKGRLTLTFIFGVLRMLAFIGVGVFSALIVLALRNGTDFDPYLVAQLRQGWDFFLGPFKEFQNRNINRKDALVLKW